MPIRASHIPASASAESPAPNSPSTNRSASNETHWLETTLLSHPLVGKIYAPARDAWVTQGELVEALLHGRFVLLGEKHDHRDHHRLEAFLLSQVLAKRPGMPVAFEMLDAEQQPLIDEFLDAHPGDVDGLARIVDWENSGWPPWPMYRPVFAAALGGEARIAAANLSRERARAILRSSRDTPAPSFPWLPPLPERELGALAEEMRNSHCGALPESALPGMVLTQRVRDWSLAERVWEADRGTGAVLCAGAEHVRKDRGAPVALAARGALGVVSLAFLEVIRGQQDPVAYLDRAGTVPPFDFTWFTPRVDEKDPCEQLKPSRR
jgi:uncharacterized iron-regulated protein